MAVTGDPGYLTELLTRGKELSPEYRSLEGLPCHRLLSQYSSFLLPLLSSLTFPLVGMPGTSETLLEYTQTIYKVPGSHQGHIKTGRGESGCVSAS